MFKLFKLTHRQRQNIFPYLLLLPALMAIFGVIFYPIIKAVIMSLQSYSLLELDNVHFVGLKNYIKVVNDHVFWISLGNTLWYLFGSVGIEFIIGLITALLLNQKFKFRGFIRTIILIPWVLPSILTAFTWSWMLNGNYGLINDILARLGIITKFIPWLASEKTALPAVILATVWKGTPFFVIMLLAGLQAVPRDLYEAASIDGASQWQKLIYIILPTIMPVIVTTTLLRVIWTANSVDIIYLMTQGGPGNETQVLSVYTYSKAQSTLNYGYTSAMAMFLTLFLLIFVIFYLKRVKKAGMTI